jgi:hypothetical protein
MSATPFDVSPREAWLELQYSKLSAEVEYHRQMDKERYSVTQAPETVFISPASRTLQVAAACHARVDAFDRKLHVYVRSDVQEFGEVSLRYFVNDLDLMNARHASAVMEQMHKKAVFDIGRHLWEPKK